MEGEGGREGWMEGGRELQGEGEGRSASIQHYEHTDVHG